MQVKTDIHVVLCIHAPYLPEYKSQLQHLFLLLISRVRLILRML